MPTVEAKFRAPALLSAAVTTEVPLGALASKALMLNVGEPTGAQVPNVKKGVNMHNHKINQIEPHGFAACTTVWPRADCFTNSTV